MSSNPINRLVIGTKGAGEIASAVAWRLHKANIRRIFMLEIPDPQAVRREVSFCEAIHEGSKTIEGLEAVKVDSVKGVREAWNKGNIAVLADTEWRDKIRPDVIVDAILAKKNLGTTTEDAPLVIGLGPGFVAGKDVHIVIETKRGHNLGKIITSGSAERNTGIPGSIKGYTAKRVLRAPVSGVFRTRRAISDAVRCGDVVGVVEETEVYAEISGIIRGLIRPGVRVTRGLKIGDIDPRGNADYCHTISDKARAISGSVLEAILRLYNSESE